MTYLWCSIHYLSQRSVNSNLQKSKLAMLYGLLIEIIDFISFKAFGFPVGSRIIISKYFYQYIDWHAILD